MHQAAEEIVARIVAQPHLRMTDAEAAILLSVPERTLMMDKLLAVHLHRQKDLDLALPIARSIFQRERTSENAKNVAHMMRGMGQVQDAIAFLEAEGEVLEPIILNDMLCMCHTTAGNHEKARHHGSVSLSLKDAGAPPAPTLSPVVRPFNPLTPRRNVIVFSLWGADRRYSDGMQYNTIVARYLYPGWSMRIYLDASVPEPVRRTLRYQGADLREPPADWPAATHGLFWRFLVEDDPDVDHYLVRDADSVMNIRERVAVEDWLASGRAFHVMRDFPAHSELILAGMWGAHRGNIGDMRARVDDHIRTGPKRLNNVTTDQEFLRNRIWPIVRQHALVHDEQFDFGETTPYRDEFRLPPNRHIGQNDWVHRKPGKPAV